MSLASRRRSSGDSPSDDAKSSIIGLSGWLFADLLLALAVVFLVASEVPKASGSKASDVSDIEVTFLTSKNGSPTRQLSQIDEPFDVWLRFSEPVKPETLDLSDISIKPESQWTYQFVNKETDGPGQVFLLRLAPLAARSAGIELTLRDKAAQHATRASSFSKAASLSVSVTICRSLTGIAVNPGDTARFLLPGGANKSAAELAKWLSSSSRQDDPPHPRGSSNEGYGTASLVYEEYVSDQADRRQVGFAILFGGYEKATESERDGVRRARSQVENVREALRSLGLLPRLITTGSNRCPQAAEVPVRPFSDSSISRSDLQFELYFYNLEN